MNISESVRDNIWLRRYSYFTAFSVLILILKGALVTSNDAGLAVPDWPSSFGENMFLFPPSKWVGGIFYEHGHRLLASFVGFLMIVLTAWVWIKDKRRWVKYLTLASLFMVIIQGILGGLTVLYFLPVKISSAHAVLAQTFFISVVIIAYSQSKECKLREQSSVRQNTRRGFYLALLFVLFIYLQLIIGALMRHSYAGLAVPDFPTMGGSFIPGLGNQFLAEVNRLRAELKLPAVDIVQVYLHLLHRLFAVFVVLSFIPLFFFVRRRIAPGILWLQRARSLTIFSAILLFVQFCLGIFTLLTLRNPWVASLHVMLGALLLAFAVLIAIRFYYYVT